MAALTEVNHKGLQQAVERMHTYKATLAQSVPVTETFQGNAVWEGLVHIFHIKGHLMATRAHALVDADRGERQATVLCRAAPRAGYVALEAVRAAIVAETRETQ